MAESESEAQQEARAELRDAVYRALSYKSVWGRDLFRYDRTVGIELGFEDYSRDKIPESVTQFVRDQYPNRALGIGKIELNYTERLRWWDVAAQFPIDQDAVVLIHAEHTYPRHEKEIECEQTQIKVDEDELTGLPITLNVAHIERELDWNYFIQPETNQILCNAVCISPYHDPMDFGVTYFDLDTYLERRRGKESAAEKLMRSISPLSRIADPLRLFEGGFNAERPLESFLGFGSSESKPLSPAVLTDLATLIATNPTETRFNRRIIL